ncbi:hypothetical protein F4678DRAFT_465734 [Xylaria arbuscula]|nr:hypothetical protein F4678DRAFT_465734 [Xylaria arbuscula]
MPSFAARLAWNPQREFKRKETNQHLNKAKSAFQAVGLVECKEKGLRPNKNGVLEDKGDFVSGVGDDQASGNPTIDAPQYTGHNPTGQDNMTDHSNLLPAPPNVALPEFSTTLEAANLPTILH